MTEFDWHNSCDKECVLGNKCCGFSKLESGSLQLHNSATAELVLRMTFRLHCVCKELMFERCGCVCACVVCLLDGWCA